MIAVCQLDDELSAWEEEDESEGDWEAGMRFVATLFFLLHTTMG